MLRYLAPLTILAACSVDPNAPSVSMFPGASGFSNLTQSQRRGEVEVYVKTNHPAIVAQIRSGAGAELAEAYRLAGVPTDEQRIRTLQLRGDIALYQDSPAALVSAILLFGG